MSNEELYSDKLKKGNRTYFFDIKQTENGDLYFKISEQKQVGENYERYRIMVFKEDFEDFEKSFIKLISKVKKLKRSDSESREEAYSVEEIRKEHGQAYMPWSENDDQKLELLFCEGKSVKELASIFERKEGAIRSRIKKLELKEKYDI
jgi:hypothetical protein